MHFRALRQWLSSLLLGTLPLLAACSSGSVSSTPAIDSPKTTLQLQQPDTMTVVNDVSYRLVSTTPAPWDSVAHDGYTPRQTSFVGTPFKPPALHSTMLQQHPLFASALRRPNSIISGNDGGGQAGWYFHANEQGGEDGSTWATMSAYLTGTVKSIPTIGANTNILYAPTMKGPNNGCLEYGVEYVYTGSFHTYFYAVDWCNNGSGHFWEVTQSFINTYVAVSTNGDRYPDISAESKLESDRLYHMLIYNNITRLYDDFGHTTSGTPSQGYSFGGEGWSIWESHYYNVGQLCPQTPSMATAGVRFRNVSGIWTYPYPDSGQIEIDNNVNLPRDCFYAPYAIEVLPRRPDLGWFSTYVT